MMNLKGVATLFLVLAFSGSSLAAQSTRHALTIHSATQAVAAVTSGDFDALRAGKEIACLMADGSVVELALSPTGWTSATIFKNQPAFPWESPAQRVSLNVGDVLPAPAGPEIVLSYQSYVVAIYRGPSNTWTNEIVADYSEFIGTTWGAEVGDCDATDSGDEVFSIFEGVLDFSIGTLYGEGDGTWKSKQIYNAEVGMDAAIGDANPDLNGHEIILVTEMGPAYEITPPAGGGAGLWPRRTIWDDFDNAGWVVKIADVDPDSPGNELIYGTRYTDRIMMSRHNGTNRHNVDILFTGINTNMFNNMFDVDAGQIFPATPAKEILGVDGSGSAYVVQKVTNHWQGSMLWQDSNALHAVVAADLIPAPGDEVVVAGASRTVTILCDPAPVLSVSRTAPNQTVLSWTALKGLTYTVEAATNLNANPMWSGLTNVIYPGAFAGFLSYTNTISGSERYFRVKASRQP